MNNSSLLTNVSKLTQHDYESVIQSLITNVDTVWVNALAFEINSPEVKKKMYELREAGLVKIWDYEVSMNRHSEKIINKVLTLEQHKKNTASLNTIMQEKANKGFEVSSDFTTFNIEQRNMLSNLLTAKFCGAESIIQRNSIRTNITTGNTDMFQAYADCLFNETNIYTLSGLSVDEILNLRKYSKHFRKKIQEKIDEHMISGEVPISVIRQDCKELSREYCDEINSRISSSLTTFGTGTGIALDIASFWVIPVTLYSIAQKLWDATFHQSQRGFVLYLTTLKKNSDRS